ncbi:MAG: hypothetical protein BWY57_01229 [Betaproteobacteria bacterium ADurb.Bin341]|nr:MAG: hypothetical protein BWY57_01229 [Betaproteobacteria bacterium ADurb.Bin341]
MHAQRHIGILGGVSGGTFQVDLIEADLVGTFAAHLGIGNGFEIEVTIAQLFEIVSLVRFQHVGLEHRVVRDAG